MSISTKRILPFAAVALTSAGYSALLQNEDLPSGVVSMKGALHRGNTTDAVEDTLRAYKATPSAFMLETDLRRCKDGIINGHDYDMSRVSNGRSKLRYASATVAQIKTVPLGKDGKDHSITLQEILALKRPVILELKDNDAKNYAGPRPDSESAQMVADEVQKYAVSARNNTVFESFNLATLEALHDIMAKKNLTKGFGYVLLVGSEAGTVRHTINQGQNLAGGFLNRHKLIAAAVAEVKGHSEQISQGGNAIVAEGLTPLRAAIDNAGYSDIGFAASTGVIKCMSRQAISTTKVKFGWDCATKADFAYLIGRGVKPIADIQAIP